VSIFIQVYNGSDYLAIAIQSCLNQTYSNYEIIVVNDGSTDKGGTRKIALSFGNRIRYFEKENGGVSTALNYGISQAQGSLVEWVSHDDMISPRKLELQLKALEKAKDPNKTLVYCSLRDVNEQGKKSPLQFFHSQRRGSFKGMDHYFPADLQIASALMPRDFFKSHQVNANSRYTPDTELYFDFLKEGYTFLHCRHVYYLSRVHAKQVTVNRLDLFEKDLKNLDRRYLAYLTESKNIAFGRKYYYYIKKKESRYSFYQQFEDTLVPTLKELKIDSPWMYMKGFLVKCCTWFPYKIRKVFFKR
jgi:glycosyltransferase involved in cell wall biosynthesis